MNIPDDIMRDIHIGLARGEMEYEQEHEDEVQVTCDECKRLFWIPAWQFHEDIQFEAIFSCEDCTGPTRP